jgi:hypothetical protein
VHDRERVVRRAEDHVVASFASRDSREGKTLEFMTRGDLRRSLPLEGLSTRANEPKPRRAEVV